MFKVRLLYVSAIVVLLLCECASLGESANLETPNVIVFFVDDLGYGDLGYSGHPTSFTPFIDDLAKNSMIFSNAHVTSPICSPSRSSLLTGRYQMRSGVYPGTFIPDSILGLPENETTIAQMLKQKNYQTKIIGKWHLGVGVGNEYLPTNFGFDSFFGLPYSHDMCPCHICYPNETACFDNCWGDSYYVSCPLYRNEEIIEQPVHLPTLTTRFVAEAVQFITSSVKANSPFFLYFPFQHVHHPQFSSGRFYQKSLRGKFGDSLLELDWAIEQVMMAVEMTGALNSTFLWFTSDNGPSMLRQERGGCAGLFRCGKGTTWEGGVRVPAFISWLDQIPSGCSNAVISTLDILPTIASLTKTTLPDVPIDGQDISNILLDGENGDEERIYAIYPESPTEDTGPFAVLYKGFKAHFFTKGSDLSDAINYDPVCPGTAALTQHNPPLLYDLNIDPGERYNLANKPEYEDLLEFLTQWRSQHMSNMTWMPPRTQVTLERAQPCCTVPTCEPFPTCCDCT